MGEHSEFIKPEGWRAALELMGQITVLSRGDLEECLLAISDQGFNALRNLILNDPLTLLGKVQPEDFRRISDWRTEWLASGWGQFFIKNKTRPLQVRRSPAVKGRDYITISARPQVRAKILQVRRLIEDQGERATDSEVVNMGVLALPLDPVALLDSHREIRKLDRRRKE